LSLADSDHDGLSDALEQTLLLQFVPNFMIGRNDCSSVPGEFKSGTNTPLLKAENGTIYGQVFPVKTFAAGQSTVEIHFYHLWRQDCGPHPHPLDTEHVSVLVRASGPNRGMSGWRALYWYAAAHENTVCNVSQIARASTLHAEDRGAWVWISPDKHASYLNEAVCETGCGADRCENMMRLHVPQVINLGEPGYPMNGSLLISAALWPLEGKMAVSNFPTGPLSRLDRLPEGEIAGFNAGRHPAQGVISISSSTQATLADGGRSASSALSTAGDSAGNAMETTYRHTLHAVGTSIKRTASGLHLIPKHR
jgi:hypothetical protein